MTTLPKLGMRSMGSCIVHLDDVFVPDDLVLGEPGKAWYMLLPTLNNERIMVGGVLYLGVLDGVLEDALEYMQQRKAFGKTHRRVSDVAALRRRHRHVAAVRRADAATTARICNRRDCPVIRSPAC